MMKIKPRYAVLAVVCASFLSGCLAKDIPYSEQQQRMARCDQYIGQGRDMCLRGEPVTIDDFKEDFTDYTKSKAKEAEKAKPKLVLPVVIKPEEGQ